MKKAKALLLSAGLMTVSSIVLLALTALIVGKSGKLPRGSVSVITTVVACLSVFLGSFFSSLYLKEKGILLGLINAFLFSVCMTLISFFWFQNVLGLASIAKFAAIFLSGAIAGILGVNRKSRVKF